MDCSFVTVFMSWSVETLYGNSLSSIKPLLLPKHGSSDGSADDSHPAAPGSNLGVGSYENQLLSVTRIDGYVMSNK